LILKHFEKVIKSHFVRKSGVDPPTKVPSDF
jgi:hypothetical protein